MSKHPALHMSKVRQKAWLDHADPDDFFEMLSLLSRLYAKKKYKIKPIYNSGQLLVDYNEYIERKVKNIKFTNNVPFLSSNDAPGSYIEVPPKSESTMDEINKMIDEL